MSEHVSESEQKNTSETRRPDFSALLGAGLAGLVAGGLIVGIVMFTVMPSMMVITEASRFGLKTTVEKLQNSIEENGWSVAGVSNMNKSMAKHGVKLEPQVRLVNLCHPKYAKSVLETDRYVTPMMPCTFGVWQDDDGKVYISKVNMELMATMFGGNVKEVMGGKVAEDEKRILAGILKK